jgi:hypothetical protein
MTPEKQRIAIAEACGLNRLAPFRRFTRTGKKSPHGVVIKYCEEAHGGAEIWAEIPNYLTDLNAMHEAAEVILGKSDAWVRFIDHLCDITGAVNCSMIDALIITNRATAAQWTEAVLRTIGKWEDEV